MVQSIISTYFGVCFPHRTVCDEDIDEVYIHLYEASSARFSVKVITTIALAEKAVQDFNSEWTLETFLEVKEPLLMSVTGQMEQQEVGRSFLGPVFEEKFHVKCLSCFILPCVPMIPEHMKTMAHPDISPTQFEEGIKSGYYTVNLSMNQGFGNPDFTYAQAPENDAQDNGDEMEHSEIHSDNEEIESRRGSITEENDENDEQDSSDIASRTRNFEEEGFENSFREYDSEGDEGDEGDERDEEDQEDDHDASSRGDGIDASELVNEAGGASSLPTNAQNAEASNTENRSQSSSSSVLAAALRQARINSSGSSSNSSTSSSSRRQTTFSCNNTSQQNLNEYIARNRNQVAISSYFDKVSTVTSSTRRQSSQSTDEILSTRAQKKRSANVLDNTDENMHNKRARSISEQSDTENLSSSSRSREVSELSQVNEIARKESQANVQGETSTPIQQAEGSNTAVKSKSRGRGRPKGSGKKNKGKQKATEAELNEGASAYGSVEQFVFRVEDDD